MAETRAQKNRKVRQEALRMQLSQQKHVEHVIDIVDELRDPEVNLKDGMLERYKLVISTKLRIIDKYLPDLKSQELTGDGGQDLFTEVPILSKEEAVSLRTLLDDKY